MSDLDATLHFDGPLFVEDDVEQTTETAPAAQDADESAS